MPVIIDKDKIIIENGLIGKILNLKASKIVSSSVHNKLNNTMIDFENDSNEFVVCFKNLFGGEYVRSDDLKIKNAFSEIVENCERLLIEFKQFKIKGCKIKLTLAYELCNNDFYLRKYLIFACEGEKQGNAVVDYIDFEPLKITDRSKSWCLPEQEKSHIDSTALSLGQPVFYSSAFFGCEFPATMNTINDDFISVKRYYGKSIAELCNQSGLFVTDKAVCGVAQIEMFGAVRNAFFDYIAKISRKTKFRKQYNSWYDHMLDISRENIKQSFLEIEKGMNSVGIEVMDSYVVDDGWNDYSSDFWRFNSKFPDELYSSSALAKALGSTFGLWLGPRGGYTKDTIKFARHIEAGGNGFVNRKAHDICVASDKYIQKTSALMMDFQNRFELDYWKLDGFAQRACTNKNHDHATGGKNNMYFYSELWEKWLSVFENLCSKKDGSPFINLTCYAPPSPWILQWVNTLWMQCSDDMGLLKKFDDGRKDCGSHKDMVLSYRDGRYYDFYSERQFCFPAGRLYNHDPIYANEAGISMTDDEFREYMFTNVARGTQFFELYFSSNLMNEAKWRITNSALLFAKENSDILSKTVMFGGKPTAAQVYGFGAFGNNEGFITLRNPDCKEKDFIFVLDETVGTNPSLESATVCNILPYDKAGKGESYSYGDKFKAEIPAYTTRIYHFGRKRRTLECVYKKARNSKTLELMFNQPINADMISCDYNPIENIRLLEDYRSVFIEFRYDFVEHNQITLKNVVDILGNKTDIDVSFRYYKDYIIDKSGIEGNDDFTIKVTPGGEYISSLFRQGSDIELYMRNNRVVFKVGTDELISNSSTDNVVQIYAVRERNGVLKLYINGQLDCGKKTNGFFVENKTPYCFDINRTKLYCKAFRYDEI